jgi:hypothetical protein
MSDEKKNEIEDILNPKPKKQTKKEESVISIDKHLETIKYDSLPDFHKQAITKMHCGKLLHPAEWDAILQTELTTRA